MGFLDSKIKNVDNGRQVLEMPNSVNFVVMTSDDILLLGSQYRASINDKTLNMFGGYVEDGETLNSSLIRELKEETNLDLVDISEIIIVYENKFVSMGYTTEKNSLYIIKLHSKYNDIKDKLKCNDLDENIEILSFNISEIDELDKKINSCKFTALKLFLNTTFIKKQMLIDYVRTKLDYLVNHTTGIAQVTFPFSMVEHVYSYLREHNIEMKYNDIEYDGDNVYIDSYLLDDDYYYEVYNDGTIMEVRRRQLIL